MASSSWHQDELGQTLGTSCGEQGTSGTPQGSAALSLPGQLAVVGENWEPLGSSHEHSTAGELALLHALDQPQLHDKHICCCWKFYVEKKIA